MMFKPKEKTVDVSGQTVTLREMSAEDMLSMEEDSDMAVVVAYCIEGTTAEQVRKWPMSVVRELYDHAVDVCGLDAGNG
tara:strand:- start:8775 stop:9011 length:237 start_codon:yes stop_codon:yes gene_type:complete